MKSARIKAISTYLPNKTVSNEDLKEDFPDLIPDRVASKLGIDARHVVVEETVSDMAVKACEQLFDEYSIARETIDFLLLCTQSPDYYLPTTACLVQHRLGLSTSCGALDYNLGCSGYVYGLAIAKGLVQSGVATNVLLVTSETYSKFLHKLDRANRSIFGDGATATLISCDGAFDIEGFELGTDGGGADNLIVKNGGLKHPAFDGVDYTDESGSIRNANNLYMNGSAIFQFTSANIPPLVSSILSKHNLTQDSIDLAVFHQANKFILQHLQKKIGFSEDIFYIDMNTYGNTVSSTIPIALKSAWSAGKAKGNILLVGFGVGYSWGACIIKQTTNGNTR